MDNLSDIDPTNWTVTTDYIQDGNGEDVLYNLSDIDNRDFMLWVLDAIQEYVKAGGVAGANARYREGRYVRD